MSNFQKQSVTGPSLSEEAAEIAAQGEAEEAGILIYLHPEDRPDMADILERSDLSFLTRPLF